MGNLRSKMLAKSLEDIKKDLNDLTINKLKDRLKELWVNYVYEYNLKDSESLDEFVTIIESIIGVNLFEEYIVFIKTKYNEDEIDEEFVFDNISENILVDFYKYFTKENLIKIIIRLYEFTEYKII